MKLPKRLGRLRLGTCCGARRSGVLFFTRCPHCEGELCAGCRQNVKGTDGVVRCPHCFGYINIPSTTATLVDEEDMPWTQSARDRREIEKMNDLD
jgi:hypothetical protein